jgi:putative transposase
MGPTLLFRTLRGQKSTEEEMTTLKRRSIRLRGHDYSNVNVYFVTICSFQKECIFGEIRNGIMGFSYYGLELLKSWQDTEKHHQNVLLGDFIIMPNHFHATLWIVGRDTARDGDTSGTEGTAGDWGTAGRAPTFEQFGKPVHDSLPTIVRSFKSATTKKINELRGMTGVPVWQRNYYEHIVRDSADLNRIEEYIQNNPARWDMDEENPKLIGSR